MTLVLYATHGFHFRNLLDSELLNLLAGRFRVVVITGSRDAEHVRADYGGAVEVVVVDVAPRPIEAKLEFVRKTLVVKPERAMTTSIFADTERRSHPVRYALLRQVNQVLGRYSWVRRGWLAFERALVPGREFDPVLLALAPSVVVTANYGTDAGTTRLLRSASRLGIPTLSIVPSFDNLTSKGAMGACASRMLVWNEIMRREAIQLHDVSPDAVVACGPVQFDIYARPEKWAPREHVWQCLGLDARRPTYVVGTITPLYFPYNLDVIEMIAEAIGQGELPRESQLLVRLHPQVVDDNLFGDNIDSYRKLAARYPFIALNVPRVRNWGDLRPPAKDDMAVLATILAGATAVAIPASTLAIDAAAVDTPVIGLAFEGKSQQPSMGSVERMFYYTHYQPLTESGAITLARSRDELIQALLRATSERCARAAERRWLVQEIIGRHDGNAAHRIVAEIERVAQRIP